MTNRPPVDHHRKALDMQASGDLYDANLHALLYIGSAIEKLTEALAPARVVTVDPPKLAAEDPAVVLEALREIQERKAGPSPDPKDRRRSGLRWAR